MSLLAATCWMLASNAAAMLPNRIDAEPPHSSALVIDKAVRANQDLKAWAAGLDMSVAPLLEEYLGGAGRVREAFLATHEAREDVIHGADPEFVLETVWSALKAARSASARPRSNTALARLAVQTSFNNLERAQIELLKETKALIEEFKARGWAEAHRLPDLASYEENLAVGFKSWSELAREMASLKPQAPPEFVEGLERISQDSVYQLAPTP